MAKKFLVIANCKQGGRTAFFDQLLSELATCSVFDDISLVVMPPVPYLGQLVSASPQVFQWGVQMVSGRSGTAWTGSYDASMVADIGAQYVCIGHSERRQHDREDSLVTISQYQQVVEAGLTPIFCVGETAKQRAQGQSITILESQLSAVFNSDCFAKLPKHDIIVAYEPVWAIGADKPADAQSVSTEFSWLASYLTAQFSHGQYTLCYGGSVGPGNCQQFAKLPEVNGLLVGRASLDIDAMKGVLLECSGY
jgi:triosephosphate isomerase